MKLVLSVFFSQELLPQKTFSLDSLESKLNNHCYRFHQLYSLQGSNVQLTDQRPNQPNFRVDHCKAVYPAVSPIRHYIVKYHVTFNRINTSHKTALESTVIRTQINKTIS